eukprot:3986264-Alexandrium_andersonii.AAC.1
MGAVGAVGAVGGVKAINNNRSSTNTHKRSRELLVRMLALPLWRCKTKKISCSLPRLTIASMNKKDTGAYPMLHAKAANTRTACGS